MFLQPSALLKFLANRKSDLHMHTTYSDGQLGPEAMIQSAIAKKVEVVGISDHAPIPFKPVSWSLHFDQISEYLAEIHQLKVRYKDQIEVLTGLEIDYFEGCEEHIERLQLERFDYAIGSVHFFSIRNQQGQFFGIDTSPQEFATAINFTGGPQKVVANYYQMVVETARMQRFSFIGHFDLIKKYNFNNRHFNENKEWYKEIVFSALAEIQPLNIPLEINTSAQRKGHPDFYPSDFIIAEIKRLKIPLIVNSDAHTCEDVAFGQPLRV